jgi:hypothetical protein
MKYQVTFRKDKDHQNPTDFLRLPGDAELIDCTIIKSSTRSQAWVYEYNEKPEHSGAIEAAFDACPTVTRWKQVAEREYYVVTTHGSGWFITAGPFDSTKAAQDVISCTSTDIYSVTEYRNARVVTWNQISRLRTGVPPKRIGDERRWQMWEEYAERRRTESAS